MFMINELRSILERDFKWELRDKLYTISYIYSDFEFKQFKTSFSTYKKRYIITISIIHNNISCSIIDSMDTVRYDLKIVAIDLKELSMRNVNYINDITTDMFSEIIRKEYKDEK